MRLAIRPKPDDPECRLTYGSDSIVAVHGLAVHPMDTWVHRTTKVNWLSDKAMLPAALPRARIMAYNYESYWFGEDAVHTSVDAVSGHLLTALDDKRKASSPQFCSRTRSWRANQPQTYRNAGTAPSFSSVTALEGWSFSVSVHSTLLSLFASDRGPPYP